MKLNKTILTLLLVLTLLSGCDDDVPHWTDVCIKDHIQLVMMPTVIGKTTIMQQQPIVICDQYQTTCIIPDDWEGYPECPPIKKQEVNNEE